MIVWKPLVVVSAVLLVGCTSDAGSAELPEPDQQSQHAAPGPTGQLPSPSGEDGPADATVEAVDGAVDGPLMRHPVRSDVEEGEGAEIRGVLELEGGCLYLVDEIGGRYPVLWPARTVWDAQHNVVVLPTGDEIAVGDRASGGGGYSSADHIEVIAGSAAADLAGRCTDNTVYGEIAVVNNYDTAIGPG